MKSVRDNIFFDEIQHMWQLKDVVVTKPVYQKVWGFVLIKVGQHLNNMWHPITSIVGEHANKNYLTPN